MLFLLKYKLPNNKERKDKNLNLFLHREPIILGYRYIDIVPIVMVTLM